MYSCIQYFFIVTFLKICKTIYSYLAIYTSFLRLNFKLTMVYQSYTLSIYVKSEYFLYLLLKKLSFSYLNIKIKFIVIICKRLFFLVFDFCNYYCTRLLFLDLEMYNTGKQ